MSDLLHGADVDNLDTPRGKAIGLGRIKIPRMPKIGFDYEIPLLSYIALERGVSDYIVTCIHMQIDGYGRTVKAACDDMIDGVLHYLGENFKHPDCEGDAWNNLLGLMLSNERTNLLWDRYHALQIGFARRGTPTDRYSGLISNMQALQDEVRKLDAKIGEKDAEIGKKNAAILEKDLEIRKKTAEIDESRDTISRLWDWYLHEILRSKDKNPLVMEEQVV